MENKKSVFDTLYEIDVNEHVETKKQDNNVELKYLSWCWGWKEVKEKYPDATYEIKKFKNELTGKITPYLEDENLGYMVFTEMTIGGITHEMWLPVMDGKNKAMKRESYEYETKFGKKKVEAATMFDINKTIMRCLTKNIAMFGLGLYIYAGEDLPEGAVPKHWKQELVAKAETLDVDFDRYAKYVGKEKYQLTNADLQKAITQKEAYLEAQNNIPGEIVV